MLRRTFAWLVFVASCGLGAVGCEAAPQPGDGGVRGDAGPLCTRDADCDDGLFCNGASRCAPGVGSDARGCVASAAPCVAGQVCDEARDTCQTECAVTRDADADGHFAVECGGDDCDDSDATRAPGRAEVCDPSSHDEDCDGATFGARDADGDGFVDASCCNVVAGTSRCGDDCDDARAATRPDAGEICNALDDDCDEALDEGVLVAFYVDADGDLFGAAGTSARTGCVLPAGYANNDTDCEDADPTIHPGVVPVCDGADEACQGTIDLGCPSALLMGTSTTSARIGATAATTPVFRLDCAAGSAVVGIDFRLAACADLGAHAAALRLQCAPLSLGRTSATPYAYSADFGALAGTAERGCLGAAASTVQARCPAHAAVTRVRGRWGGGGMSGFFGPISVDCSTIEVPSVRGTYFLQVDAPVEVATTGGEGYLNGFDFACPEGSVLTGVDGTISYDEISWLSFDCTPISLVVTAP